MARALATVAALTWGTCHATPAPAPPPTTTVPPPASTTAPPTTHVHPPSVPGGPAGEGVLHAIARCESGGRYDAENPTSTASGKYQVIDSTWGGYGGYRHASDAPPEVQEAFARELLARAGTAPWRASRSCWRAAP